MGSDATAVFDESLGEEDSDGRLESKLVSRFLGLRAMRRFGSLRESGVGIGPAHHSRAPKKVSFFSS